MKSTMFQLGLPCLAFLLTSAVQAKADVFLLIDDFQLDPIAVNLLGPVADPSIQITQKGTGILGTADAQFDYVSSDPSLASGQSVTYNYNVYGPFTTILRDTLSITVTGITPTGGNASNVSVDAVFTTVSLNGGYPAPLVGGVAITEDQSLLQPTGMPDGTYQYVDSPLTDLTVGFNAAPEPVFFPLVGLGMAGIVAYRFRRRKQIAVTKD